MRVNVGQLRHSLQQALPPIIIISGEEPLQREESVDLVRAAARTQGYDERITLHADNRFDWNELVGLGDSFSLFAQKRLVEVRILAAINDAGRKTLAAFASSPPEDIILSLVMPRLDGRALRAKWLTLLEQAGLLVQVWPIDMRDLPAWVSARGKRSGLTLTTEAASLLAERSEGNLLACAQELDKLSLAGHEAEITLEMVRAAVTDSARFDPFDLVDAALGGDALRVVRISDGLRDEGAQIPAVLGALCWGLRCVTEISVRQSAGESLESILSRHLGVWRIPQRRRLLAGALRRHPAGRWQAFLRQAAHVDALAKGSPPRWLQGGRIGPDEGWGELKALGLAVAGVNILSSNRFTLRI